MCHEVVMNQDTKADNVKSPNGDYEEELNEEERLPQVGVS